MKRKNNLYEQINDIDVIMDMYDNVVKKNTRNKKRIRRFDDYYSCNIASIKNKINSRNYIPNNNHIFLIREPKLRIIMSQDISDKIIDHLVAKYFLVNVFDKILIKENCATRIGKGTHYAIKLFKKNYNYYVNKYDKFYMLKFDISKYFYNIDHEITKNLIRRKIKDKDALKILDSIIDSTDYEYVNKTIMRLKQIEKDKLKNYEGADKDIKLLEIDRLPLYKKGKGLSIGRMISQTIATFYLDELDHYIKEKLKIKAYVRYQDDAILIHQDKEYLKFCLKEIEKILTKYKLQLNSKTKIYSSTEEIEFLGFRFLYNNKIVMKISNKTKKRFKKKMRKLYINYNNELVNYDELRSIRDSYLGHLKYGSCKQLIDNNILF